MNKRRTTAKPSITGPTIASNPDQPLHNLMIWAHQAGGEKWDTRVPDEVAKAVIAPTTQRQIVKSTVRRLRVSPRTSGGGGSQNIRPTGFHQFPSQIQIYPTLVGKVQTTSTGDNNISATYCLCGQHM